MLKTTSTFFVCIAFVATCSAQWLWLDQDGRKVFSDRAPGAEVPAQNILKQPRTTAPSNLDAPTAEPPAKELKPTDKDAALLNKKKAAESEEEAQRKAQAEKIAAAKVENCEQARRSLNTLQSGIRLSVASADGERVVLDDAARAAEVRRVQEAVASNCK